ncbi:Ras-like G protein, putative [Plasmodium chabaudi chabaudi]|uniref:Ras-like G protein, putative n=1 Tax=Plasmodium chabaudi chabaudi TaxID=31271 RepID=A0A4V0K312_PLACU|nr:Ras-like G protein, putative [Plasmodium chabaudi chabaudi]VTZ67248.1 Ras-like G protein, putative [Plasmodium chabaudi chabaudi]|eukprot:XP_738573.2 GTP-binding protein, putative [Plasmodium chabaudi chabaudi]
MKYINKIVLIKNVYYKHVQFRKIYYKINIVGACNSGKSTLNNCLLEKLNETHKKSVINNIENYCIQNNENLITIENRKCLIVDTLGVNEKMLKKLEIWKSKNYDKNFENNNIIKNYFNTIINSNLILFPVKGSEIRQADILAHNIIKDIYKQHDNIFTIVQNNLDDIYFDEIKYNFLDMYEHFTNIIFFPYSLDSHNKNANLINIIKERVKQTKIEADKSVIRNNVSKNEQASFKTDFYEDPSKSDEYDMHEFIDDSLRIFRPTLNGEIKNYFYKFIDLKKKEKSNDQLFNDYFSKKILNKELKTISQDDLQKKYANRMYEPRKEENNNNDYNNNNDIDQSNNENETKALKDEGKWIDPNNIEKWVQENTEDGKEKKIFKKLKNKRMELLRKIINRDKDTNLYSLINLSKNQISINQENEKNKISSDDNDVTSHCVEEETQVCQPGDSANYLEEDEISKCSSYDTFDESTMAKEERANDWISKTANLAEHKSENKPSEIKVCILGEKNCGKTTLIETVLKKNIINENDIYELFGKKRKYVNEDMSIVYKDQKISILDTCSLKKQHRFRNEDLYYDEENRVYNNIRKSDICVYIKEAKDNNICLNKDDKKMLFYLLKEKKNIIFIVSKIDLIVTDYENKRSEFLKSITNTFSDIPVLFLNNNNDSHVNSLLKLITHINKRNNITISTSTLNLFLIQFIKLFPIPWLKKQKCNFKFIKQIRQNPVTFLIFTNLYKNIPNNYLTFFKKKLKDQFDLKYVNIQFVFKTTCDNKNVKKNQIIK